MYKQEFIIQYVIAWKAHVEGEIASVADIVSEAECVWSEMCRLGYGEENPVWQFNEYIIGGSDTHGENIKDFGRCD